MEVTPSTYVDPFDTFNVYFAGSMNGWTSAINNDAYKLAYENEEYSITVDIPENGKFKVVFVKGDNQDWYGATENADEDGNFVITESGQYKVTASKTEITYEKVGDFTCTHEGKWDHGVCTYCKYECEHENYVNEKCEICGNDCPHNSGYNEGKCNDCGHECKHDSGYNEESKCNTCGLSCDHNYIDGVCTKCGAGCDHTYLDEECTKCHTPNPTWKTYYFKPWGDWKASSARFKAVLTKTIGGTDDKIMSHFDFKDYHTFSIDTALYSQIQIKRLDPSNLNNAWNSSTTFNLNKDYNLITQPSTWNDWTGTFSNFSGTNSGTLGLVGTMNGWSNDDKLTLNSEGNYVGTLDVGDTAVSFKIRANNEWTYSWGYPDLESQYSFVSPDDTNIKISAKGTYTITFNPNTLKISISQ